MSASLAWFIGTAIMLPLMWWAGVRVGRVTDPTRRAVYIAVVMGLLFLWCWLIRNPSVAVEVLPLSMLARIEGIGAAPLFIFVVGVAWALGHLKRQRAIVAVALFMGAGYFVQGGWWMVQQTPAGAFAHESYSPSMDVLQSQDYSCVPAACATSLRLMGVQTDEAEMARLTETRPGSGATLLRAMHGLKKRLAHEGLEPHLVEPSYDQLMALPTPVLTPLQYEASQLHMVSILNVIAEGVYVADPAVGIEFIPRARFEEIYRRQAIAFEFTEGPKPEAVVQARTSWLRASAHPTGW
ncbi:MAG: cysteine peptidase family C39 domain-containing protein [Phycisphaerales bacterium JB063]